MGNCGSASMRRRSTLYIVFCDRLEVRCISNFLWFPACVIFQAPDSAIGKRLNTVGCAFAMGICKKKYGSELPSFNIDELTTVQPISRELEVTKILKLAATPSDFSDRVFRYGDIGIKGFQNIKHLWDQNPFFSRSFFMGSLNLDIPKVVPTKDF